MTIETGTEEIEVEIAIEIGTETEIIIKDTKVIDTGAAEEVEVENIRKRKDHLTVQGKPSMQLYFFCIKFYRRRSDSREDRHKRKKEKDRKHRKESADSDNSLERYYNRVKLRVQQGIPTKFSTFQDPRYQVKYQTPQEKLDEYKRENPNIDTTVHNKTDRQLYIGNLPPDITIPELCKHLNDAMYALNL